MGASKNLFMQLAEKEIQTNSFLASKKEIEKGAIEFANNLLEAGEVDKIEALAQLARISTMVNSTLEVVKKSFKDAEKVEAFGITVQTVNGGSLPQYEEDEVYSDLKKKLKEREELLKTALKIDQTLYDDEGVEVPKVSSKPKADSVQIKF